MLYYHWRNEESDILEKDCEEIFNKHRKDIQKKRLEYNKISEEDLKEYEKQLLEDQERYHQYEKENERYQEDREYIEEYAEQQDFVTDILLQDNYDAEGNKVQKFLAPKMMKDEEYTELLRSLNEKQKNFLYHVLCFVKKNQFIALKDQEQIFNYVSGSAGVGKSRLITAIAQTVTKYSRENTNGPINEENPHVLIVAPTGKAAFNVRGMTMHSAFNLLIREGKKSDKSKKLAADTLNTMRSQLSQLKILIIEEISMVGVDTFIQTHMRLQEIFYNNLPFGGINVISFGDFKQLRPVKDGYVFKSSNKEDYILAGNSLWSQFKFYELTEIMRQKDDIPFANALNNLGLGQLTDDDIKMFESRLNLSSIPEDAIHLYYRNEDVNKYNIQKVNKIINQNHKENAISKAIDEQLGPGSKSYKNKRLKEVKKRDSAQNHGLPNELLLVIDAKYMITNNIDVPDGLFNGAIGYLRKIVYGDLKKKDDVIEKNVPSSLFMEFDKGIGTEAMAKCGKNKDPDYKGLVPIQRIRRVVYDDKSAQIVRNQFPLIVAESITIHKSQGSTYKNVAVDLTRCDRQLTYVALSRATTLNGLYIKGDFPKIKPISSDDPVIKEIIRLKTYCNLVFPFKLLNQINNTKKNVIRIMYHNVQSFYAHKQDVESDMNFMCCDLLMFVESHLNGRKIDNLRGFDCINRFDNNYRGNLCYKKQSNNNIKMVESTVYLHGDLEIFMAEINDEIAVICVYAAVKLNHGNVADCLQMYFQIAEVDLNKYKFVLLWGDFNLNEVVERNHLSRFLMEYEFIPYFKEHKVTTDKNTCLDLVYVRKNVFRILNFSHEIGIYESYFSYHKPLYCVFYY